MTTRTDFAFWLSQQPDTIAGLDPAQVQAIKAAFPLDDVTVARAHFRDLPRLAPRDPRAQITLRALVNRYRQHVARIAREAKAAQLEAWRASQRAVRERA